MQVGATVRLRDVAAAALVSVGAASRYLNGTLRLPEETGARIDRAAASLGYHPNPHARRLSLGRSDTIGLVVPDIANPFFGELAGAVEAEARARGLDLLLCVTRDDPVRELDYLALLQRSRVDGMLLAINRPSDDTLAAAVNAAGRIVLLDEDVPGTRVPKVFADNVQGGFLAASHLLAAGHRNLGFIGGPLRMLSTTERLGGFAQAMTQAGLDGDAVATRCGPYTRAQGALSIRQLLASDTPPTGVLVASDELLVGVLEAARASGHRVPRDLSVVSFDDVQPLQLFGPPVTAVRQPLAEMGRRAFALLGAESQADPETIRLAVSLVERGSVAPPAPRRRGARKRAFPTPRPAKD